MPTHKPLFSWLEEAQQRPQHTAWLTAEDSLSYRALYRQTRSLAAHCLQAGLAPGEPLAAVYAGRQQLGRAALLAMYLGCPLLPLRPQRASFLPVLKRCGIRQILSDNAPGYAGYRCFSSHPGTDEQSAADCPPRPLPGDQTQLFIATSGSSGQARVTRHSGDSLAASVTASQAHTGLGCRDVWLNCLPMHHIGGFAILLRCLHAGAAMRIEEDFDAERIFNHLQRFAITHLSLVPAMLAELLTVQGERKFPDRLRCVLVGGGPLSEPLAQQALAQGWPLSVTWGMSETASHVTLHKLDSGWTPGMVGRPVRGCRLDIVDRQGQTVPGRGRVRIRGPMLMQGYYSDGDSRDNGIDAGCFTSSDSGYLDSDGNLHLCGRADQQLVSGGYTIDPETVEASLRQCKGIGQVAVTAIEDANWGDLLLVLFTGPATPQGVLRWCRTRLDSWTRPRRALKTGSLPCTELGKPDRPAIARLAAQLTAQR